jgi:deferrochelatase/peroxidase EfeB
VLSVRPFKKVGDFYDHEQLHYCLWFIIGADTQDDLLSAARAVVDRMSVTVE